MTPCPTCHAQPILERSAGRYRYNCPHRNLAPGRGGFRRGGCEKFTEYWNTTEKGARQSWEKAVGTAAPAERCPRCGLREPHLCLMGDAQSRDGSRSWWSERKSHHRYTDEESAAK